MRYILYIVLTFFILLECSIAQNVRDQYSLFKSRYRLAGYYQFGTRILIDSIPVDNLPLIDSMYYMPFHLVDTVQDDKELKITKLLDFECRLLSFIEGQKYDCVVTMSYTSTAGNGNPIIMVNTFNKIGQFLSRASFDLVGQNDYSPVPMQYFSIDLKNTISMELVLKNYEIVDSLGIEVLQYIGTEHINEYYTIDHNGMIVKE